MFLTVGSLRIVCSILNLQFEIIVEPLLLNGVHFAIIAFAKLFMIRVSRVSNMIQSAKWLFNRPLLSNNRSICIFTWINSYAEVVNENNFLVTKWWYIFKLYNDRWFFPTFFNVGDSIFVINKIKYIFDQLEMYYTSLNGFKSFPFIFIFEFGLF